MPKSLVLCVAFGSLALSSCTTTPDLSEATGGIPVYDIVLRTKCELSAAFEDDQGNWIVDAYPKFAWLQDWVAQIDLNLQVLDQATLSPGASVTQPFHNAYPPSVGPSSASTSGVLGTTISGVSQSFAIAGGASLNGQAQRTETLSFALSVKELKEWRSDPTTSQLCAVSDNMDLRGRLGLKEWLRDALWPIASERELLFAGYHPNSSTGSRSVQQPTPKPKQTTAPLTIVAAKRGCTTGDLKPLSDKLDSARQTLNSVAGSADAASKQLDAATSTFKSAQSKLKQSTDALQQIQGRFGPVLDPAVQISERASAANLDWARRFSKAAGKSLNMARDEVEAANKAKDDVTTAQDALKAQSQDLDRCVLAELDQLVANAVTSVNNAAAAIPDAAKKVMEATTNLKGMQSNIDAVTAFTSRPINPPVASIGQAVQFTLAYGGSVTPTWTFVRFKGPTSPLFSTSGTRIHTLNITLGPVNPTTNAPSEDVKQNQFYLQLNNLLTPLAQ